jgi:hypothetical protein
MFRRMLMAAAAAAKTAYDWFREDPWLRTEAW